MRKRCAWLLAAWLAGPAGAAEDPFRIVTSFYPIHIAVLNVARNIPGVEVINLTPPVTGCLHEYSMTPQDLRTLARADAFVVNGLGMESFLDEAVKRLPRLRVIDASRGIEPLDDNPHVWVSVTLAIQQVRTIADALEEFDPDHAERYRANADAYIAQLDALRRKMREGLDGVKNRHIVTLHEAFPYFAQEFGLRVIAVIEREPGSEPGARELAQTIDLVRQTGAPALFAEPQYPAKAIDTIAAETGAKVYTLDPAVTGPMEPGAYVGIMETNLETLIAALKEEPRPRTEVESPKQPTLDMGL